MERLRTLGGHLLVQTTSRPAAGDDGATPRALAPPPHGQVGPAVANNNVIVFFTDQQRFDTSSLHGNPMNLTPNFDRMAQRGTHIAEAVTCQPVCGPARSAFQTGLWPTTSGCFRNNIGLPDDSPKIAELFRDAGCERLSPCLFPLPPSDHSLLSLMCAQTTQDTSGSGSKHFMTSCLGPVVDRSECN